MSATQAVVLLGGPANGLTTTVPRSVSRINVPKDGVEYLYTVRRVWLGQEARDLFVYAPLSNEQGFDRLMDLLWAHSPHRRQAIGAAQIPGDIEP